MDKDFEKRLRNFGRVWARVQGAKEPEKPKAQAPNKNSCQKKAQRGRGKRF